MADGWVRVAAKADVAEGKVLGVKVGGKDVAIYHLPGGILCATDNICTHEYALLSEGWLENGCIECPLHAAQFDCRTGKALSSPADEDLVVYQIKAEGDDLLLQILEMPVPIVIDCDVHPTVPGIKALLPYLDDHWREAVVRRGIDDQTTISYPTINPLTFRSDWKDETGKAGTSAARLGEQALDPFGTSFAICNCLYGAQAAFSEDLGVAMARAVNDWVAKEWLDRDPRLRASIVVPQQNAEFAVDEIERVAKDRRFIQVLLLVGSELTLGRRHYWPIYAAAERLGLTIGIHAGSMFRHPTTPIGWPSSYTEEYVNQATAFQSQLTSLITEGVFAKFPGLTVVLMESGVSWLPAYLWRLTKFWKGLRSEVPWIADPPASIIRDRVRLTLQPFDAPSDEGGVMRLMDQIGSDEMLLFSTDYPHWQFDGLAAMPAGIDPALAKKIMADNPLRTYVRLQQTEPVA